MPGSPLRMLAEQFGILSSYVDQFGHTRQTSDRTRRALLLALGVEAGTAAEIRGALRAEQARLADQVIGPVRVAEPSAARRLALAPPPGGGRAWTIDIDFETGERLRLNGRRLSRSILLPPLPLGYHRVRLTTSGPRMAERVVEQGLIVTPPRCPSPHDLLGGRRAYGLLVNLYSVRSAHNWGAGDLSDLKRLVEWGADIGASFVGINPLHALENRGDQISPYSPVSRLFRNVLYLDPAAIPEWRDLAEAERSRLAAARADLRAADHIDYDEVRARKWPALRAVHRQFAARHRDASTRRGAAYRRYLTDGGDALRDFATFAALQEHFEARGRRAWREWPAAYRQPRLPEVQRFRDANAEAVDLHCYLQFELDRQLGAVAATARRRGMPIGVYQDLALGSSRRGSDPWAFPGLFVDGADLGAPPDDYSTSGQNWALPPLDPRALAAGGYQYWVRVLRAALRHAGALRIDHVMGLFRQYWIPTGASGADGAYMRFPFDDLLGILALESQRAQALVIGEDLGTVPRGLPAILARHSILSTRVLYFERTAAGGFRSARSYPRRALVGANTHDLVPLAGFWEGADLTLRRQLGLLASDEALATSRAARAKERSALLDRLRRDGALPARRRGRGQSDPREPSAGELTGAVHTFLAKTPAALVGLSLDDLTGERQPVNVPGVGRDQHPSWTRRMRTPIESLPADAALAPALGALPSGPRRLPAAPGRRRRTVGQGIASRRRRRNAAE